MPIPYDKTFSKELTQIITHHASAFLHDEVATLKSAQKKSAAIHRGPLYLEIAKSAVTHVLDQEGPRSIYITPFVYEPGNQEEVALWLGLSVRFDYEISLHDFALTSISVSFIRGSQTKDYLLRAEWDSRIEDANHAQPHWHAIPGQAVRKDAIEERWGDIQSHMHLAMCARWRSNADKGSLCHTHSLHAEDVLSWLEQTLVYAKHQAEYGLAKFPPRSTPVEGFFA